MPVDELIAAFASEFGIAPSEANRFGATTHRLRGVCDGARGVQWNTWPSFRENAAHLGVTLEGMKYDGWPIARFIERWFNHPQLFEVRSRLVTPATVELVVHRDAWQVSARPPIDERHIGAANERGRETNPLDGQLGGVRAVPPIALSPVLDPDDLHATSSRPTAFVSTSANSCRH